MTQGSKGSLIVTGCGGFVAGSVLRQAGLEWDVYAVSRGPALLERNGLTWRQMDAMQGDALASLFEEVRPKACIHCAAIAAIDYCEQNEEEATRVNTLFAGDVAQCCAEHGTRLIYCSTDNAFNGDEGMYREEQRPSPINFYGLTKVAGEQVVREFVEDAVVARVALVMGLHVLGEGNSFLSAMMRKFRMGETVGVPSEEIRTPIDVATLGQALLELAGNGYRGFLNLAGNSRENRLDMVRRIAAELGFSGSLVEANDPTDIPGRAPRPVDVSLDNARARDVLETPFCEIEEGLRRALALAGHAG